MKSMVIFCPQNGRNVNGPPHERGLRRSCIYNGRTRIRPGDTGSLSFCRVKVYACMVTVSSPIVSSRTVSTSPACSQSRSPSGLPRMTPDGVPVRITSPG